MALALRAIPTADEPSVGLTKLAREALERADGNWERAMVVLRSIVLDDRALYERLIEPLIDDGLWVAIRQAARAERQALTRAVANPDKGVAGIVAMVEHTLYDMPLPGGKPLGSATSGDLLVAIEFYTAQARGNTVQARRYALVRDALGPGTCVEQAVPLTMLNRLWMQAEED